MRTCKITGSMLLQNNKFIPLCSANSDTMLYKIMSPTFPDLNVCDCHLLGHWNTDLM